MKPETKLLRELPSVDRVVNHPAAARLLKTFSRPFVTETLRGLLTTCGRPSSPATTFRPTGCGTNPS